MRRIGMASIVLLLLSACWGLPEDFPSLTLDEKIAAYERHLKWGGAQNSENALGWISWHGHEAAQRMVPYIRREKRDLPLLDAIDVIWNVQARGCDLRGSEAEAALKELIEKQGRAMGNAEFIAATSAIKHIARYDPFEAGMLDTLPEGPCEREYRARKGKLNEQDDAKLPDPQ